MDGINKIKEELKERLKKEVEDYELLDFEWNEIEKWVENFYGFDSLADKTVYLIENKKVRTYAQVIENAMAFVIAKSQKEKIIKREEEEYIRLTLVLIPLTQVITSIVCEYKNIKRTD